MRERINEIISFATEPHKKYKSFENLTGIKAKTWQNIAEGRQHANDEHLQAIASKWPEFAYWLLTGKTDEEHGHTSPILERIRTDLQRAGKA
jgi:hypothetical protein